MIMIKQMLKIGSLLSTVALMGLASSHAQPIAVPNHSFESQPAPQSPPYVNIFVDAWQRPAQPDYWSQIETNFGIPWVGSAAVFYDTNPYLNRDGIQAGYLLSFPGVALFQNNIGANFQVGNAYQMTVGVFGKSSLSPSSTLEIAMFFQNGQDQVVVGTPTIVTYSPATFPGGPPWNLVDYQVNVPTVQSGDAWANQPIGIRFLVTSMESSGGNWDIDNVRLMAIPEPSSLSLLAVAACAAWVARRQLGKS
jgi:hypothetical protein